MPTGPNCLRRALLEMRLDGGAAGEPLRIGLQKSGGFGSGHAWLDGSDPEATHYDAEFVL